MLWYLEEQEIQALLGFNLFPFWTGILPVAVAPSTSLFSKAVYVPFLSSMQLQFWAFQNKTVFSLPYFISTYLENLAIYLSVKEKMSEQPAEH